MCPLQLTSEHHTCETEPWWLFMPWISPYPIRGYSTTCRHTIISVGTQVNSKTSCPVKSFLDVQKSLFQPVMLVRRHSRMSWLVSLVPCPHLHHPGHRTDVQFWLLWLKKHMKKINTIQTGCILQRLRLSPHFQVQQVNSSWVITAFMLLLAQSFKPEPNPEPLHHHTCLHPPRPHWITDRSGVCDFILRKWRVGLASCKDCTVKGFILSGNTLCHFLFPCFLDNCWNWKTYPFQLIPFKKGNFSLAAYKQMAMYK